MDRGQGLDSSSEVEVASGSRGGFGSKVAVDNYSGKGGIDVGNYIFPFVYATYSYESRMGV